MIDPHVGAVIGALPIEEQFTYMVGRVVRADLSLENTLRSLWLTLHPNQGRRPIPHTFSKLLQQCVDKVPGQDFGDELASDLPAQILHAVSAAHDGRNRVVHDDVLPEYIDGRPSSDSFVAHRYEPGSTLPGEMTPRTLDGMVEVEVELWRATHRVSALTWLSPSSPLDGLMRRLMSRTAEGHFELADNPRAYHPR